MINNFLLIIFSVATLMTAQAQNKLPQGNIEAKPKLIIGIVVDQMRYDYLYRFAENYTEGGFKRLMKQGYSCENTHYNYAPTHTAPGHSSIYTGTTPAIHGIIGNYWYDRGESKQVYCVSDSSMISVGSDSKEGKMSPMRLLSTTIGDELKLSNQNRSKVFGVSLKDRGSILPGGRFANAAYWFDSESGNMITSNYYMDKLPDWLEKFNAKKLVDSYLDQKWETLLPIEKYTASDQDDSPYEGGFNGGKPVFPYDLKELRGKDFSMLPESPFGNKLILELAMDLIKNENLGKGKNIDLLALSFSAPDYVGHQFGVTSIEVEDIYLRLDRDIEVLLNFIDTWIGKDNVLIFLTSDHGVGHNPQYLLDRKLPGGSFQTRACADSVRSKLKEKYGDKPWLLSFYKLQFVLDQNLIERSGFKIEEFENFIADQIRFFPGIAEIVTGKNLRELEYAKPPLALLQSGYNHRRSGDVLVNLQPGWMEWSSKTGTQHGSPYAYDTHIPLVWYGWKIKPGNDIDRINITDIAPTISSLMKIEMPSGSTGQPIKLPLR